MPEETVGIETLKDAVHLAIAIPFQVAKTVKQKFQLFDILAFIDEIKELVAVVKEKDQISLELKDLSAEEKEELLAYVKDEFNIPDDSLELFVENALTWAASTLALITEAKRLKKK